MQQFFAERHFGFQALVPGCIVAGFNDDGLLLFGICGAHQPLLQLRIGLLQPAHLRHSGGNGVRQHGVVFLVSVKHFFGGFRRQLATEFGHFHVFAASAVCVANHRKQAVASGFIVRYSKIVVLHVCLYPRLIGQLLVFGVLGLGGVFGLRRQRKRLRLHLGP